MKVSSPNDGCMDDNSSRIIQPASSFSLLNVHYRHKITEGYTAFGVARSIFILTAIRSTAGDGNLCGLKLCVNFEDVSKFIELFIKNRPNKYMVCWAAMAIA